MSPVNEITINPVWTLRRFDLPPLPPRLPELLVQVHALGSLLAASRELEMSYRHAWSLVKAGEQYFGRPLLVMRRGRGSTLTPLGEALVWADRRIMGTLAPVLDSLSSELAMEINRVIAPGPADLRIHASHGFAVERLIGALLRRGMVVEHRWVSSLEAASALHDQRCELAGLHIPDGQLQAPALEHYAPWLHGPDLRIIEVATRHQGLMVAPANPHKIYGMADLARPDVRFVNRQAGSGTRFLVERLLALEGIDPAMIPGFEQGEATHRAIAAVVASGKADAGMGLETPARELRLDFIPLASERYILACTPPMLELPAIQAVLEVLRSDDYRASVDALQGYDARCSGRVLPFDEAFPG